MDRSVELSEEAFAAAQRIVTENGFSSIAEYLDQLIFFDEMDRSGVSAEHAKKLIETLEKNEPATPFTRADFDALRERARRVAAASAASRASA